MDQADSDVIDFRGLFHSVQEYEGSDLDQEVLRPWLVESGELARRWLTGVAARRGDPIPDADPEELFDLYALSRLNDLLLWNLAIAAEGDAWKDCWAPLSQDAYAAFMTGLGLELKQEADFSPFVHEIALVEQGDDDSAPITVVRELWPPVMLGEMMISRAGVVVRGGRAHVDKEVAETSTLYWAHSRRNRPTSDLSDGWGQNSAWGTAFRRDYRIGDRLYFNVDGADDLRWRAPDSTVDGLSLSDQIELVLHRGLVVRDYPQGQAWPFDDSYECLAGRAPFASQARDLDWFDREVDALGALHAVDPGDPAIARDLILVLDGCMDLCLQAQDVHGAEAAERRARTIAEGVAAGRPADRRTLSDLHLAARKFVGRASEAGENPWLALAFVFTRDLVAACAGRPADADIARCCGKQGALAEKVSGSPMAKAWYELGLRAAEMEPHAEIDAPALKDSAAFARSRLGALALQAGDKAGASSWFERLVATVDAREASDYAKDCLSYALMSLGDLAEADGDEAAVGRWLAQAMAMTDVPAAVRPSDIHNLERLVVLLERYGDHAWRVGDLVAARRRFERGQALAARRLKAVPADTAFVEYLSVFLERRANLAVRVGNDWWARRLLQRARRLREGLRGTDSAQADQDYGLAVIYIRLGFIEARAKRFGKALDWLTKTIHLREALAARDPRDAKAQAELFEAYDEAGGMAVGAGDYETARDMYRHASDLADRLYQADPANAVAEGALTRALGKLADLDKTPPVKRFRLLR